MNCYLEGIKQKALLNYTVDKWEFVGPPYYAPQVRSSLQRKLFFTICRRQILHHAQRAFFTTASAVLIPPQYRERSEPNSEPPYGGGSLVARCVSAGYPEGERLEPRRGAVESCCLVYGLN